MPESSLSQHPYHAPLLQCLQRIDAHLSLAQQQQLLDYHRLLLHWNRAFNLTAIRDPLQMLEKHLQDCLSLLPLLGPYQSLLDVGTGAGLPGIPLAIARPQADYALLDSNGKKTRFLLQVTTELRLTQVQIINARLAQYTAPRRFDVITSRAFAALADMVQQSRHLLQANGRFIAMKGLYPEAELAALPADVQVVAVHRVTDIQQAQRHVVILSLPEAATDPARG